MAELYAHRKRREAREAAIAAGTFEWKHALPYAAWVRIATVVGALQSGSWSNPGVEAKNKAKILLGIDIYGNFNTVFTDQFAPSFEDRLSLLEIFYQELSAQPFPGQEESARETLSHNVDRILCDYGCAVRMAEGRIVPHDSPELFEQVVAPTLRLLRGSEFPAVEKAFQDALKGLHANEPAVAIAEAGVALQELLRVRGYAGGQIKDQLKKARSDGWLKGNDQKLIDAVDNIFDWASAQRNDGKVHKADMGDTALGDGWLMVHIVGALIVRLAEGDKRGE